MATTKNILQAIEKVAGEPIPKRATEGFQPTKKGILQSIETQGPPDLEIPPSPPDITPEPSPEEEQSLWGKIKNFFFEDLSKKIKRPEPPPPPVIDRVLELAPYMGEMAKETLGTAKTTIQKEIKAKGMGGATFDALANLGGVIMGAGPRFIKSTIALVDEDLAEKIFPEKVTHPTEMFLNAIGKGHLIKEHQEWNVGPAATVEVKRCIADGGDPTVCALFAGSSIIFDAAIFLGAAEGAIKMVAGKPMPVSGMPKDKASKILEVPKDAPKAQVQQSYYTKAHKIHPDKVYGEFYPKDPPTEVITKAIKDFSELNKAYQAFTGVQPKSIAQSTRDVLRELVKSRKLWSEAVEDVVAGTGKEAIRVPMISPRPEAKPPIPRPPIIKPGIKPLIEVKPPVRPPVVIPKVGKGEIVTIKAKIGEVTQKVKFIEEKPDKFIASRLEEPGAGLLMSFPKDAWEIVKPEIVKEVKAPAGPPQKEEIIRGITTAEKKLVEQYKPVSKKVNEALGQIWSEMEVAEAGKRIRAGEADQIIGEKWIGVKSTFPEWIPEDLRSKELLDKVMEGLSDINNIRFPSENRSAQRELYNTILDELDSRVGINTSETRKSIIENYERIYEKEVTEPVGEGPERRAAPIKEEEITSVDLDRWFKEGMERENLYQQKGKIRIPFQKRVRVESPQTIKNIQIQNKGFLERIKEFFKPITFYSDVPMELRNAIRTEMVGSLTRAYEKVYGKIATYIWGGMEIEDISTSIELIFGRDQLARTKMGIGNPEIGIKEAEEVLKDIEARTTPEAVEAANRWNEVKERFRQTLVQKGILPEDSKIEFYAPHYVLDYTPEWAFNVGVPTRLRRPFRGYKIRARGTTKAYRQDSDALLGHLLKVEWDNTIETFIQKWAKKYDISAEFTKEQKIKYFGKTPKGLIRSYGKPGRVYVIEGDRYRAYTPDVPFSRQLFPTEEGLTAIGRFKKTYLVPENIYDTFRDFSERGGASLYYINRAVGEWKTMAILSNFPHFNIQNFVGDTWMLMIQVPEPLKVVGEYRTAANYLSQDSTKYSPYLQGFHKFMTDNDILGATFLKTEVARMRRSRNPYQWLVKQSWRLSQYREAFNRTAHASYLYRNMEDGKGEELVEFYNWIDTEGLSVDKALGKIARDTLVDYGWVSKTFRRLIRGLAFPFGTWYFKGSTLVWKWALRNWGKALAIFLGIPVLATVFNNRNEKIRELEKGLPDSVRDKTHLILGENPDGSVRVWFVSMPQDALIGTKIFSIAVNQANMVVNGEKSVEEAAKDTLKRWGIRETKGIAYLMSPMVRFIKGLIDQQDPYDKTRIYPVSPTKLSAFDRLKYQGLYFIKTSMPYFSTYISDVRRGKVVDVILEDWLDRFAGKGAFGIYDVNKKGKIVLIHEATGQKIELDWDDVSKVQAIEAEEIKRLSRIEDAWVKSGLLPDEFVQTDEYKKLIKDIWNIWVKQVPSLKEMELSEEKLIEEVEGSLGERLANQLGEDSLSAQRWLQTQLDRAKTPEEKKSIRKMFEEIRKQRILDSLKQKSKTAREIYLLKLLEETK